MGAEIKHRLSLNSDRERSAGAEASFRQAVRQGCIEGHCHKSVAHAVIAEKRAGGSALSVQGCSSALAPLIPTTNTC